MRGRKNEKCNRQPSADQHKIKSGCPEPAQRDSRNRRTEQLTEPPGICQYITTRSRAGRVKKIMLILTRDQARQEVRAQWVKFGQPDRSGRGIICPICGNGSGADGDGITENPHKPGQLKCWKCGFTGDSIDLYMKEYEVDYNTALQAMADFLGYGIEAYDGSDRAGAAQSGFKSKADKIHTEQSQEGTGTATTADYADYYLQCEQRIDDPAALSYLQARGISRETAAAYHLGYDPAWISPEAIRRQRAKGSDWTPPATARLIMPVSRNHYVARAISQDIEKKYQKMNETGGGPACIFNLPAIRQGQAVFIVEGIIDALSIVEAGGQAIALNSTSNADQLIKLLERQNTDCSFIICPDNDDAGRRAAETIENGLQRLHIKHITANVSGDYKDANDCLTADRQALEQAIKAAQAKAEAAPVPDCLTDFFEEISGDKYKPYATDLQWFDMLLSGGPIRQTVLLLLAAPAAGKTTLAQQIAECMAKHKKPVLYLNLEMSRNQMIAKSISSRVTFKGCPMTATDVLQGYQWTDQQRQEVESALQEYREFILPYLEYNPDNVGSDLSAIQKAITSAGTAAVQAGKEAPVIILDYLHLVSMPEARGDIQETIKQSVLMLKRYAMKFNTICIAISATNRESNKDGRITRDSGRDSSNIEYTGDYILSLNYYQIDKGTVKTKELDKIAVLEARPWRQIIIRTLKNRFGVSGRSARVYLHAPGSRFYPEHDTFIPVSVVGFDEYDPQLEHDEEKNREYIEKAKADADAIENRLKGRKRL